MRKQLRAEQDKMVQEIAAALKGASPEALQAALKTLRNGKGTKKRKKPSRFRGSDHWLSRPEFDALCAASDPFYALLWKTCLAHALRISEAQLKEEQERQRVQ